MTVKLRTLGIAVLVLLVLAGGGIALFLYAGVYNVAATKQHTKPVLHLLDYAMRRSIAARSDTIEVPDLNNTQRIRNGAVHYRAHCLQCHGAPGVSPHPLAFGMTPVPANLVATAREWRAADVFWVIKHGIKMSGMPAWEYRMSDNDIWDIVAFVESMPTLSPQEYMELDKQLANVHAQEANGRAGRPAEGHAQGSKPDPSATQAPAKNEEAVLGNVEAGRRAAGQYLCATCHQIPGMAAASRHVGPPLNGMAGRKFIGGVLPNNPENMVRWLQDPQQFDPLSAMPDLGVSEKDARDIAAFLYTMEDLE